MPKPTKPALTAEFVRSILDYDPKTGLFRWRYRENVPQQWNTKYAGTIAGSPGPKGHIKIQIGKRHHYSAHVLAWLLLHDEWRPDEIDHADRDPANNCGNNLRIADYSENGCNKAMQKNNTSGFVGVSFDTQRGKWRARIFKHRKVVFSEFFDTAEQANEARKASLADHHGEFAAT